MKSIKCLDYFLDEQPMEISNKLGTLKKLDSLLPPALQKYSWGLKPRMAAAESVGGQLCLH